MCSSYSDSESDIISYLRPAAGVIAEGRRAKIEEEEEEEEEKIIIISKSELESKELSTHVLKSLRNYLYILDVKMNEETAKVFNLYDDNVKQKKTLIELNNFDNKWYIKYRDIDDEKVNLMDNFKKVHEAITNYVSESESSSVSSLESEQKEKQKIDKNNIKDIRDFLWSMKKAIKGYNEEQQKEESYVLLNELKFDFPDVFFKVLTTNDKCEKLSSEINSYVLFSNFKNQILYQHIEGGHVSNVGHTDYKNTWVKDMNENVIQKIETALKALYNNTIKSDETANAYYEDIAKAIGEAIGEAIEEKDKTNIVAYCKKNYKELKKYHADNDLGAADWANKILQKAGVGNITEDTLKTVFEKFTKEQKQSLSYSYSDNTLKSAYEGQINAQFDMYKTSSLTDEQKMIFFSFNNDEAIGFDNFQKAKDADDFVVQVMGEEKIIKENLEALYDTAFKVS